MKTETCPLEGLIIIQPQVFHDSRGYFFESFNKKKLESILNGVEFVQDNQSFSCKNVLRGLHFQHPPYAQGKLVRVVRGAVLDVAVDLRKKSPTYGQHFCIFLSEKNQTMFYIPPGFAHGFLTLEDNTIFLYKCTNYYEKSSEDCIVWNDPTLNIPWNVENPIVSEKDQQGKLFSSFISPF
ncbi:MAG: dTDP-4-dehydrorhamnose 3,5-epimerase [Bacteroidia bacterium]|nr:dTDP-4-dehydrorhamnose 3,5-epimerase [Bacteroidia bacterium]